MEMQPEWSLKSEVLSRIGSIENQMVHYRKEIEYAQIEQRHSQVTLDQLGEQLGEWRTLAAAHGFIGD